MKGERNEIEICANSLLQPIEAILMVLCMLVASGRLVPRLVQGQHLTLSDSLLVVSILDAIGLFATDVLTYEYGGMSEEETESSVAQTIALKKVRTIVRRFTNIEELTSRN